PDAVYAFFSGGGAVKFVKDYAAAGLKDKIALYGPGFLTEGVSRAQGAAAEGVKTTLHYADNLDLPANKAFRAAYKKAYAKDANVFAVQGYDTGSLLLAAMEKVKGDSGAIKEMIATMEAAKLKSPRGNISFSKAHNVVQDIYLRKVVKGEQQLVGVVAKQLADPAQGCRLV
ncbi:MAG: ABC transporter substrate-binding protein, partial [Bauldia litoralis]